jgi:chemotaxis protein CheX
MEVKYINSFLEALEYVLTQFGIADIQIGNFQKKGSMFIEADITAVIGLVGAIRGNIAFSLPEDSAKKIISTMMGGASVPEMDEIAKSAIGEVANMVMGSAATRLSQLGAVTDITPPSILFGRQTLLVLSSLQTIEILVTSKVGNITVNISLEM